MARPVQSLSAPDASRAAPHFQGIDALRGAALLLMGVYHFCFDLAYFGWLRADFNHDPFWLGFRGFIVTAFLTLVGVSLALADSRGQRPGAFWRRIGRVAACAALVTAMSLAMFPQSYIYFGILHHIALASLIAWPLRRYVIETALLGLALILAGNLVTFPAFEPRLLNWIGLSPTKPLTEDYVPLLPWLGVVLIGLAAATHLLRRRAVALRGLDDLAPAWLAWLGRHSLAVYMIHQPVFFALLFLARAFFS
jgi:uncharacterized membrane protein